MPECLKCLCVRSVFLLLAVGAAWAAPPDGVSSVRFDAGSRVFRMDAAGVTYAFGVNDRQELQTLYWGGRLQESDGFVAAKAGHGVASFEAPANATQQEFSGWGEGLYSEPALKVSFADGNRDLVLHYVSHEVERDGVVVTLKDISRDVFVELHYSMDASTGVLGRSAVILNRTKAPVMIEQAAAASWNLPVGSDYRLRYLSGRWAAEWTLNEQKIAPGKTVLESRRGSTGHQNSPWFAIERGDAKDEDTGEVWFGALAWSGSWSISVEQDQLRQVRVTGGFNPFDFGYRLAPGERLTTPVFYGGYSQDGIDGASRLLHRFEVTRILPQAPHPRPRPVLYNSWEATGFAVNEAGQVALAEKAASIGVERFVMDDGWFGQRKNDHAGLGDWYVNKQKFPNGLKPLIDKVHGLGMDFGLWVEPEMVNPDSDLYRKHPEWVLNFPGRPHTELRNQLVLNLARSDVRDYVLGFLDDLLKQNDIAFLKWDYNRNWAEPGWDAAATEDQKKVYVTYVENLYGILRELRARHPKVEIESCSGGGGRVDLGIMLLTDEVWTSDNTDPFDRLTIQDGFSYAYTPGVMMAWVTDSPNWVNQRTTSLEYRFLSSMQGGLGVGANLGTWSPEDFAVAKEMIAAYKEVRETVQHGDLYRLISPEGGSEASATESVSVDKRQAVVFAFLHSSQKGYPFPTVKLRGLDAAGQYRLRPIHGAKAEAAPEVASGASWMSRGLDVVLRGDFQAAGFVLEEASR
nr:alpha-galactosidase [Edaphobacter aggregans]